MPYKRKVKWNLVIAAVSALVLFFTAIIIIVQAVWPHAADMGDSPEPELVSSEPEQSSQPESTGLISGKTLCISPEEIYSGELILVNEQHAYQAEQTEMVSVYSVKNGCYWVKDKNVCIAEELSEPLNCLMEDFYHQTGLDDIMVISGWRDPEKQAGLYQDDLAETGKTDSTLVAKPGYSEHHTGYAVDLGLTQIIPGVGRDYDGEGEYSWITEHCAEYGFVIRYPSDKTEITGIDYEPWHLRYVGIPHAEIMNAENLCLEEYVEFLRNYSWESPYQTGDWLIFWQKPELSVSGELEIVVPADKPFTFSGDNIDGIICTVSLK